MHIISHTFSTIFFVNETATTEIYTRPYTLSLHDALPISHLSSRRDDSSRTVEGTSAGRWFRVRSEEHTSELQSHGLISDAVFFLKKKEICDRIFGFIVTSVGSLIARVLFLT